MAYEFHGVEPNPVRDKRVKLPFQAAKDERVPIAAHAEAVALAVGKQHLLG
jgi:hypothetical protein